MWHVIADLFEGCGYLLFDREQPFRVERADAFVGPLALLDPTFAFEYTLPQVPRRHAYALSLPGLDIC